PSCCQVTGCPSMPEPVWKLHSFFPSLASKASNSPVNWPENTTPPAVDSTPEKRGMSLGTSHFAFPVMGSMALRWQRGPSGHDQISVRSVLRYYSPCLKTAGSDL